MQRPKFNFSTFVEFVYEPLNRLTQASKQVYRWHAGHNRVPDNTIICDVTYSDQLRPVTRDIELADDHRQFVVGGQ